MKIYILCSHLAHAYKNLPVHYGSSEALTLIDFLTSYWGFETYD